MSMDGMATPTKMQRITPASARADASRSRASSDPFLDPSRSYNSTLHVSTIDDTTDTELTDPPTPLDNRHTSKLLPKQVPNTSPRTRTNITLDSLSEPQLRTWTFPASLANPELRKLLALFPSFITRQHVPRFKLQSSPKVSPRELEEGALTTDLEIRVGTGKMRLTDQYRDHGWRGGLWDRMLGWLLSIFG